MTTVLGYFVIRDELTRPAPVTPLSKSEVQLNNNQAQSNLADTDWQPAKVDHVSDGDTLTVFMNNERIRVRLYGIDAPEKDQPGGQKSKASLQSLVRDKNIRLAVKDTDQYGRKVCEVLNGDKVQVNQAQVAAGQAWWYEQYAPKATELAAAQQTAQENQLGLWTQENPTPPWEWRKAKRGYRGTPQSSSDESKP